MLIGTSRSSGLTVEASVRAIIAGVVAANLRLRPQPQEAGLASADAVAITELRFVERYEDVVELAAQALDQLTIRGRSPPPAVTHVEYDPVPAMGEGAAGAQPAERHRQRRLDAGHASRQPTGHADGLSAADLLDDGPSGPSRAVTHHVDQPLVDVARRPVDQPDRRSARSARRCTNCCCRTTSSSRSAAGSHLQLLVDDTTADYPWELLTPREEAFRDSRPLSVDRRVAPPVRRDRRTSVRGRLRAAERHPCS